MIDLEDFREEHEAAIAAAQSRGHRNGTWGPLLASALRRPRLLVILIS